eukprot:TRINITY_DN2389_c0_g1_i1.p2 TRINITY_DN2389_c0_g1~~TRINITY_DN2389_c0_g1_i1.p2  ORF type:complete len:128 (-),score=21.51 TRINITY_DN2389_c0_g1_i1:345-728(-)
MYRGADALLFIFDINSKRSFENIPEWMEQGELQLGSKVPCVVVGNKCDAIDVPRKISYESASEWCRSKEVPYIETSAKNGINTTEMLELLKQAIDFNSDLDAVYIPGGTIDLSSNAPRPSSQPDCQC